MHGISLSYTGIASGFGYWYCLKFKGPNRKLRGPGSSTIGSEECGSNDSKKILASYYYLKVEFEIL